ncbi:MAG: acyl-CoA dehydrogenase family protein [Acidimicrobiia bacterium]
MSTDVDESSLRAQVRAFLAEQYDPQLTCREWWRRLADSGWGIPTWPVEWFGRGMSADEGEIVRDEMANAGVLGAPSGAGVSMAGPVIMQYGTEEQKQRWLPALAYGLEQWGQFFSEPGAGSDLASVQTRAVRDGDEWVVNGQKVWNSGTLLADKALLVARSDVDVPKHKGITFFIFPVDQPGVDIRPIKQMNGYSEFNETFMTDCRVHDRDRLGPEGGGWAVALGILNHERANHAGGGNHELRSVAAGVKGGNLDRTVAEVLATKEEGPKSANALPIDTFDGLVSLAREYGRTGDPVIRQKLASVYAMSEAMKWTAMRGQAAAKLGRAGGAESSVAYLGGVFVVRKYRDLIGDLAGAYAQLDGNELSESITTAPCHGIQGGSEHVQRNVIGERALGLPREPQVDKDLPFRLLRVGTQRD